MIRRLFIVLGLCLAACALPAEPVCVDGVCYPSEEAARAAGVDLAKAARHADASAPDDEAGRTRRLAMGYMSVPEFVAFLRNEPPPEGLLEEKALWMVFLLVLVGGLAANLTPCVLPIVPINLILIGKGWRRGAMYALGIMTAYGALGLAAAFGGLAFGELQSSVWFNGGVALVFTVLALAMLDVFALPGFKGVKFKEAKAKGLKGPFFLGLGAATLASACVEPILIATLLLTSKWFAAGRVWAVVLPFLLGAGMGLPYPFAAAGFSVLPKPGAWMVWVKRAFALVFLVLALWYAREVVSRVRGVETPYVAESQLFAAKGGAADGAQPTLVKIGAPWCRNCAAMERTTLRDPKVTAITDGFNVRRIEIDDFAELARYPEAAGLDIKGLPAYIVVAPRVQQP